MKKIIHIAPTLPPAINGLGDFCAILAGNLEMEGYTDNVFMVRSIAHAESLSNVYDFDAHTFHDLLDRHRGDIVILHYVGYAYNPKGMPFYILRSLKKYKEKTRCRLLIFFHELYATSKSFWKLPFYTEFFQKQIVKQLCEIADSIFTNCHHYKILLQQLAERNDLQTECTGIFSNVPDDLYDRSITKEDKSLVVFGSYNRRKAVYDNPSFNTLLSNLDIRNIYDVGQGQTGFRHVNIQIHVKGSLPAHQIAGVLNKCKYGALCYKPELLGKSGIFSAYTAFGIIPFNLLDTGKPLNDGLIEGKNYFNLKYKTNENGFNESLAKQEVIKWYQTRNQKVVADKIMSHL